MQGLRKPKGPSGPRRQGEGVEDEEQEIICIDRLGNGIIQASHNCLGAPYVNLLSRVRSARADDAHRRHAVTNIDLRLRAAPRHSAGRWLRYRRIWIFREGNLSGGVKPMMRIGA